MRMVTLRIQHMKFDKLEKAKKAVDTIRGGVK